MLSLSRFDWGLVEVDGYSLVEVAEGAEVFGEGAAGQELAQTGRGAEIVVLVVHYHGVWLAVALEIVTLAEIPAFGHQVFHLAFGEVGCCFHFVLWLVDTQLIRLILISVNIFFQLFSFPYIL